MKKHLAIAAFTTLAVTGFAVSSMAQTVKHMGSMTTPQALIEALTPAAPGEEPAPFMATRGIRLQSANPATAPRPAAAPSGAPAVALDIKFALDSADLTEDAKQLVQQLATAVNSEQLKSYRFRLEGHTDSLGSANYNLALSQRRAAAVKTFMVSKLGVASERLETVGFGEDRPLDPANPAASINRRVQVQNLR